MSEPARTTLDAFASTKHPGSDSARITHAGSRRLFAVPRAGGDSVELTYQPFA